MALQDNVPLATVRLTTPPAHRYNRPGTVRAVALLKVLFAEGMAHTCYGSTIP